MARTINLYVEDTLNFHDAMLANRRRYATRQRDTVLNAVPNGKCLVLGTVWAGDLVPYVDSFVSALEPIVSGFSAGRVLNAEPASPSLDLGRAWLGDLTRRIADAVSRSTGKGNTVDLSGVLAGVQSLQEAIEAGNASNMDRAFRALKVARDALGREEREVQQALGHDSSINLAALRNKERTVTRDLQDAANAHHFPDQAASNTQVRDHLHAATTATSERARLEALNKASRAFWAQ